MSNRPIQLICLVFLWAAILPAMALPSSPPDCGPTGTVKQIVACYLPTVLDSAATWNVDPALVLAIIHQESRFNIHAVSASHALGLMQLVPSSGGKDVTRFLTGQAVTLPDSAVLEPTNNIGLGVVFLHLLKTHYLSDIHDQSAQRYAMIAAYNGGIGSLRRWYSTANVPLAVRVNANSAEYFRREIMMNHPYAETRDYLKKVDSHYRFYQALLQQLHKH